MGARAGRPVLRQRVPPTAAGKRVGVAAITTHGDERLCHPRTTARPLPHRRERLRGIGSTLAVQRRGATAAVDPCAVCAGLPKKQGGGAHSQRWQRPLASNQTIVPETLTKRVGEKPGCWVKTSPEGVCCLYMADPLPTGRTWAVGPLGDRRSS